MSHWFDRLAVRAAEDEGERLLTRRETIKVAAGGAVAAGALGSPLLSAALAEDGCACEKRVTNARNQAVADALDRLFIRSLSGGLAAFEFIGSYTAANYYSAAQGLKCPPCNDGKKLGQAPPPDFQPCLARGGLARGPQCPPGPPGGGGGGGTQDCPPGTIKCSNTLCCFGGDVCCSCGGTAQCCIAEIGCTCC